MTIYGRVEVEEQIFRLGSRGREIRPFKVSAAVECRGYSRRLQRAMVDFGAEGSYGKAEQRIKEHYGIDLSDSAVRRKTLIHAEAMKQEEEEGRVGKLGSRAGAEIVIGEMDGSFLPIVEPDSESADKRKKKALKWEEVKLVLAKELGSVTPRYAATMGSVEEAGEMLVDCAARAGAGKQTHLHCLGDGAVWIYQQVKARFGEQASYLVDFYHVTQYLAAASEKVLEGERKPWLSKQKERMLEQEIEEVIEELRGYEEGEEVAEGEAPVRVCIRYVNNHRGCMDYKGARERDLPIGSGEIEGSHRSVIQQRLKLAGAWWLRENAERMTALRIKRANGEWQSYWEQVSQEAA